MKFLTSLFILLLACSFNTKTSRADDILGKWKSDKGDLIVEVYKQNNEFKARSVWFKTKINPIDYVRDDKNPDPALRNRKLIGMDVVSQLHYDSNSGKWVDGVIYDATTGKSWDSEVWLAKPNELKVKGYWMLKFISKSMILTRVP